VEMYLAGVSVRRVEDITEALWGTRVSPSTVSELNQKIYAQIEIWRNRPIEGKHAYVFLDGLWLKRSWGGEVKNVSVLVAIGVAQSGYREILGVSEGAKEDKASWTNFLRELKQRGLKGVQLFVSDKCLGLVENFAEFYPEAKWQRCVVHFYRNVWTAVPTGKVKEVAAMLKAIHAQEIRRFDTQRRPTCFAIAIKCRISGVCCCDSQLLSPSWFVVQALGARVKRYLVFLLRCVRGVRAKAFLVDTYEKMEIAAASHRINKPGNCSVAVPEIVFPGTHSFSSSSAARPQQVVNVAAS
jgi:hypothetical protein